MMRVWQSSDPGMIVQVNPAATLLTQLQPTLSSVEQRLLHRNFLDPPQMQHDLRPTERLRMLHWERRWTVVRVQFRHPMLRLGKRWTVIQVIPRSDRQPPECH